MNPWHTNVSLVYLAPGICTKGWEIQSMSWGSKLLEKSEYFTHQIYELQSDAKMDLMCLHQLAVGEHHSDSSPYNYQ
jgi:hypothetical protein